MNVGPKVMGVAGLIVACAAGGAQAAPGGDTIVEETGFATGDGQGAAATAPCPPGRRATGGGIGALSGSIGLSLIQVSGPQGPTGLTATTVDGDPALYWYANAFTYSSGGQNSGLWRTYALCSATSDGTVATATLSLAPNSTGGTTAFCPAGRRVTGGGVGTTADAVGSTLKLSGPVDASGSTVNTVDGDIARGWLAQVRNTDQQRTYKVFAVCSATSDAIVAAADTVEPFTTGVVRQGKACPAGRRITGGGVGTLFPSFSGATRLNTPLDQTGTTDGTLDGDVATQWYVELQGAAQLDRYRVFALCATNDAGVGPGTAGPAADAQADGAVAPPWRDVARPTLSALTMAPASFKAARSGASIAAALGTKVSYRLSEAAKVAFRVEKPATGRRVGGKCVRRTRSNAAKKACRRYLPLPGSFSHEGVLGANGFRFTGTLNSGRLQPGQYRLSTVATDAARNSSDPVVKRFAIER